MMWSHWETKDFKSTVFNIDILHKICKLVLQSPPSLRTVSAGWVLSRDSDDQDEVCGIDQWARAPWQTRLRDHVGADVMSGGGGGGSSVGLNSISHAAPRITAATAEPQLQLPEIRGPEGGQWPRLRSHRERGQTVERTDKWDPHRWARTPGSSSSLPVSEREDSLFSNGSITGFYCEGAIARHLILEEMQYLYYYHNRIYTCTTAVFILVQLQCW